MRYTKQVKTNEIRLMASGGELCHRNDWPVKKGNRPRTGWFMDCAPEWFMEGRGRDDFRQYYTVIEPGNPYSEFKPHHASNAMIFMAASKMNPEPTCWCDGGDCDGEVCKLCEGNGYISCDYCDWEVVYLYDPPRESRSEFLEWAQLGRRTLTLSMRDAEETVSVNVTKAALKQLWVAWQQIRHSAHGHSVDRERCRCIEKCCRFGAALYEILTGQPLPNGVVAVKMNQE